jgi:hypothetical protein
MLCKTIVAAAVPAILLASGGSALAASPDPTAPSTAHMPAAPTAPGAERHGFSLFPEHHFQWTASDAKRPN